MASKSKEYQVGVYDTLTSYPAGSGSLGSDLFGCDSLGCDGDKAIALVHQMLTSSKDKKSANFSEVRIFDQKINGKEVVAGFSITGDKSYPLEESRFFLQDAKTCKVRPAHNYYLQRIHCSWWPGRAFSDE